MDTFDEIVKCRYDISATPAEEYGKGEKRVVLDYNEFHKLCKDMYDLGHTRGREAGYKKAEEKYINLISC